MQANMLPKYDMSDNPTDCCPRFNLEGWDNQDLHFEDKLFVKARTRSIAHIPINIGSVFSKTFSAIGEAKATGDDDFVVLSYDPSSWTGEHYFAVSKNVPDQEMVRMTGNYVTRVVEGPYNKVFEWKREMAVLAASKGKHIRKTYFFYTSCPKCAKFYGKNYVVAISEIH